MLEFDRKWETAEKTITAPLRWRKASSVRIEADLFHESVPDEWIDRVFAVMALCPQHTFQVLTKRPERARSYINDPRRPHTIARAVLDLVIADFRFVHLMNREEWPVVSIGELDDPDDVTLASWPRPNLWLGVSVEDQATADERISLLLDTPAAKRFISAEPLLGAVNLRQWQHVYGCGCGWGGDSPLDYCIHCGWRGSTPGEIGDAKCPECSKLIEDYNACPECDGHSCDGGSFGPNSTPKLDWVIVGGESGPNARPMHPNWVRSLRDQCAVAGVPFFFKQWGKWGLLARPKVHSSVGGGMPRIAWPDGTIGHGLASERGGPGQYYFRGTKSATGAVLDGREHREFPE